MPGPFPFAKPGSLVWNSSEGQPTLYYVKADGTWEWVVQIAVASGPSYTLRRNSLSAEMQAAGFQVEENDLITTNP